MSFLSYKDAYFDGCLALFDANCPEYFAENEREDYIAFLRGGSATYYVGVSEGLIVSAFGLGTTPNTRRARLSWILVLPQLKGTGFGIQMMEAAKNIALENGLGFIDIAASHLSAPFFAKFGAQPLNTTENGWGQGMHRVDMELKVR